MVRRHGWQLPAHTFQVVAITVFFLLVVAFYAFLAPFIGKKILEYTFIAAYSPVALAVFILYVRCTRINPADPGIMAKFDAKYAAANNNSKPQSMDLAAVDNPAPDTHSSASLDLEHRSPGHGQSTRTSSAQVAGRLNHLPTPSKKTNACFVVTGIFCALFANEDCRKESNDLIFGEEALFCTLCNSEVRRLSKHCRSCDKCVDGFDHHCRWLNNCVGRKNYVSFIALMATSLLWLIIEVGVGIAVLVLCFVNKKGTEDRIVEKLGNGFSRAPFAAVVAVCTAVSLLAVIPLGELFFFHLLLMKKGITTYEYVVFMRATSEVPAESANEDNQNVLYSPSGSTTTGFSGASSLGLHLQHKGVWCTPPRIFVDQDEVIPHLEPGMVPSTVDPDANDPPERGNKMPKKAVKISAWKLAKLDSDEAMKAAAKARASSSVLRPIAATSRLPDNDVSSSGNVSVRSSVSTDFGPIKEVKNELKVSPLRNIFAQCHIGKEDYDTGTQSVSSFSSPGHVHESVALSPLPLSNLVPERPVAPRPAPVTMPLTNPVFQSAISFARDTRRTSVVWDQEAGRYVSIPVTARTENVSDAQARAFRTFANPTEATHTRRPVVPDSSFSYAPRQQQPERLSYTGQSIFFGGPLLTAPVRNIRRDDGGIDQHGFSTFQHKLPRNSN